MLGCCASFWRGRFVPSEEKQISKWHVPLTWTKIVKIFLDPGEWGHCALAVNKHVWALHEYLNAKERPVSVSQLNLYFIAQYQCKPICICCLTHSKLQSATENSKLRVLCSIPMHSLWSIAICHWPIDRIGARNCNLYNSVIFVSHTQLPSSIQVWSCSKGQEQDASCTACKRDNPLRCTLQGRIDSVNPISQPNHVKLISLFINAVSYLGGGKASPSSPSVWFKSYSLHEFGLQ